MPIIDVELVQRDGEGLPEGLATTVADALGEVLGCEPGRLWVRVRSLPETQYAENLGEAPRPVFVKLLFGEPPTGERLRSQVREVAQAVASACHRPVDLVHVLVEPPAQGRIAFGGELR